MTSVVAWPRSHSASSCSSASGSAHRTLIPWVNLIGWPLLGRSTRAYSCWMRDMPARSKAPGGPRGHGCVALGLDAELGADLGDRSGGDLVEVDVEQVDAEPLAQVLSSPQRVRDADVHLGLVELAFAQVTGEEAGVGHVAGLEQSDEGRQPREALRVGVGPTDEGEHLELAVEVGAVVGEHVHEVVLGEVGRGAADRTRAARSRDCGTSPRPPDRACRARGRRSSSTARRAPRPRRPRPAGPRA